MGGSFIGAEGGIRSRLRARSGTALIATGNHSLPSRSNPLECNKKTTRVGGSFIGAEGGIRTLVCFWHKLISSQPRYDRFDTSA